MDPDSDAAAIKASLDDPSRFGVLFDRHATIVFRYLVRRVGVDAAESLLGDVFRIAFEKRAGYDCERPNARPWLYGIATNLLAHHRRSEARRIAATARLLAAPRLPEGERDALLLYVWEDLGYDEIACALEVPVGTVRSRLNRARQTLRELRASIGREQ
jgi:DNA-directed RNA polymerase specialized sigma24 family protein